MLFLDADTDKELSISDTEAIYRLLEVDTIPETPNFFTDNEIEQRRFYDFFYEVFIENEAPVALSVDWRWTPDDLFEQVQKISPKHSLELIDAQQNYDNVGNITSWHIQYGLNGNVKTITVELTIQASS